MRVIRVITVTAAVAAASAAAAVPASAAPAVKAAAAARQFEGTVVSVDRGERAFRLRDSERGTVTIVVKASTSFERLAGFGGLKAGLKRIEATVRRADGAWVAIRVERSGGGGNHGVNDDRGGDDRGRGRGADDNRDPSHATRSDDRAGDDKGGLYPHNDDPAGDDKGGQNPEHNDDPAGDDKGGQNRGSDDPAGDDRGGQNRGSDDPAGDDRGGHGTDD